MVKPEQAIIDWILRETGTEVWFSEPLGILNASNTTLRVYHTPEMQAMVGDIVDRFVNSAASAYGFTLRVSTVGNPNWRAKAIPMTKSFIAGRMAAIARRTCACSSVESLRCCWFASVEIRMASCTGGAGVIRNALQICSAPNGMNAIDPVTTKTTRFRR